MAEFNTNHRLYSQYRHEKKDHNAITRGMKAKATKARKQRIKESFVNADRFFQEQARNRRVPRG